MNQKFLIKMIIIEMKAMKRSRKEEKDERKNMKRKYDRKS